MKMNLHGNLVSIYMLRYCIDLTLINHRPIIELIVITIVCTRCALRVLFIKMFMTDFMLLCASLQNFQHNHVIQLQKQRVASKTLLIPEGNWKQECMIILGTW